jgi:hypothetical protein
MGPGDTEQVLKEMRRSTLFVFGFIVLLNVIFNINLSSAENEGNEFFLLSVKPIRLEGDYNEDGKVNMADVAVMVSDVPSLLKFVEDYSGKGNGLFGLQLYLNKVNDNFNKDFISGCSYCGSGYSNSLWIWDEDHIMGETGKEEDFFNFCLKQNIKYLYLHFSSADFEDPLEVEKMRSFLGKAKLKGYIVYYLTGSDEWALAENYDELAKRVNLYLEFNAKYGELLRGIHFDIEQGSKWFVDENKIAIEFLSGLKKIKEEHPSARVSLDVPYWLDTHSAAVPFEFDSETGLLNKHFRRYTEFLTFMDYDERSEKIISRVATEIEEGPSVIGVELSLVPDENELISFYEEDWNYFNGEMGKVSTAYSSHPNFKGFAFHHYDTFKEFYEKG